MHSPYRLLLAFCVLAAACDDGVEPDCGRCLPVTAVAVQGTLSREIGQVPLARVRLRLLDADAVPPRDTVAGCPGAVVRDTVIATDALRSFRVLLIAGFPTFDGCLEARILPAVDGAFPVMTVAYPHLALRDTSFHDTLHVAIRIP